MAIGKVKGCGGGRTGRVENRGGLIARIYVIEVNGGDETFGGRKCGRERETERG